MNLSPLSREPEKQEIKDFMTEHLLERQWSTVLNSDAKVPTSIATTLIVGVVIVIGAIVSYAMQGFPSQQAMLYIGPIALISTVIVVLCMIFLRGQAKRAEVRTALKLCQFATANSWQFQYRTSAVVWANSLLFTAGRNYQFSDVVSGPGFQIGRCSLKTGYGRNEQEHRLIYMAIPLKKDVPNMVLDGKRNDTHVLGFDISNLPVEYDRRQVVSLEGDFDSYYTLYAPKEYEVDVRYIFTPNLMQLFIDEASAGIDAEIVDNVMYIYFGSYEKLDQPVFWQRVEKILDTIGQTIERQTEYYTDSHTATGIVAPQGQRLKKGISTTAIIVALFYAVYIAFYGVTEILRAINN